MTKNIITATCFIMIATISFAQNQYKASIFDSLSKEPLIGATLFLHGTTNGTTSDANGKAILTNIPDGQHRIMISYIGYKTTTLNLSFPLEQAEPHKIFMSLSESQMEEIIIEATRANKTVANLPTRTEVLTEEIDEAASMEPSRIAHLITHSTGIQVQTTSATSNGAVVRIQGLNGRYTQILKDGFPLYGGFSGSLDVLQIPPLDLRQVEYIKGSASTLYGGGAIGGLINLLTKKPTQDETLLHINFSHIGSKDFNAFVSRKFGKFGFTNLASLHLHSPYDPDKDGYSDVPDISKFNFNPKLFYYPDNKTEIYLGATITEENRMGGDMDLIDNQQVDSTHFYFDKQKSSRYTSQFSAKRSFSSSSSLTLKNSISLFDRFIQIRENALGAITKFGGTQLNSYNELNYNLNKPAHNLNIGLNALTDNFSEQETDTNFLRNQEYITLGAYINHLWDINKKLALETGLRTDYVQANSDSSEGNGELFVLPRLSALYKMNSNFSIRLGGGMGYRMPTIFNEEAEPFGYKGIRPIDFENVKAERSYGGNIDFKYQSTFNSENILFTFNQMFFYNLIDNPILLDMDTTTGIGEYSNTGDFLNSRGFESQIKLTLWKFTWFFGYTYTEAFLQAGDLTKDLLLTPMHSIKGDLLFVEDNKWRIGWDYEYKSEQFLSNDLKSRSLFTTGVVVERTIESFVLFLNAENFTDTRQTRYESLTSNPYNTPQYTEVWAPLDGFFFNAGLKIKL
ncbi:MAG TPA: TonB-dependent receptor [Flavobacteriales bacterium]|nr:TonB-dependent receptor [Flavobacteriales bacterium]